MSENEQYWTVEYRSGAYIAKTVEEASPRILLEIAAVIRHPLQGDLHHPYRADVAMFHERRAAAYREKVWVPKSTVEPYGGAVPTYAESLRHAWQEMVRSMDKIIDSADASNGTEKDHELAQWASKSLEKLRVLEKDYWGS
ncbi:kinase [Paenibacillus mesophilus]|uniref:sporulation phosphorelay system protein KapB n=1 Tax=Paenibacillus mesophilus TaxID=2582849 RepID=UPI00110E376F|nr:sporulation phosphorelay system protein KapB [Paenibacillus mesophilus]TMV50249.1 kinase [Paenibacillus mesophilus]